VNTQDFDTHANNLHSYATLDYEDAGYEKADIVKLQLLVNKVCTTRHIVVLHLFGLNTETKK